MAAQKKYVVKSSDGSDNIAPPETVPSENVSREVNAEMVDEVDYCLIGRELAKKMNAGGYHPVIIFGSANSGKSTLLCSLFSYLRNNLNEVGIYFGDSLTSDALSEKAVVSSFFKNVEEFVEGRVPVATKTKRPFFIPIEIKPKNLPVMRFAFMESNGEWYHHDKDTERYFPELKDEINSILMCYQKGASFIHLAPFAQTNASVSNRDNLDKDKKDIADANKALVGVFDAYENSRKFKGNDAHMFLITKWDASGNNEIEEILKCAEPNDVKTVAETTYERGFAAFNKLTLGESQKSYMQYSSGIMHGTAHGTAISMATTPELKSILNRYPKIMWNWLYGNATGNDPEIDKRLVLLPVPIPPKKTFIDRINEIINRVLN